MKMFKFAVLSLGAALTLSVTAMPAQAQATRTWVSGVGDDANPCSRTAPCKTFAGAISKTATGGEINCLDPGGFGGVTITKAMSIVCQYTEGGVLVAGAGVNGIVINAPAASPVYLRGLDIFGAGNAQNGIRFIAGASLTIEDSIIRSFNATNGLGISFQPSGASFLTLNNVTIENNGVGSTGGGVLIQPTGAGGSAKVDMNDVRLTNNPNAGLRIDTTGNTSPTGVRAALSNISVSGSTTGISAFQPVGSAPEVVMVSRSKIANNTTFGLLANGAAARIRIGESVVSNNGTAAGFFGGGVVNSFGNNQINDNATTDGAFQPNPFG